MIFILVSLSLFHMANILLVIILLFLVFKYLETYWSYKISKPYAWENAVNTKKISPILLSLESRYRDKVRFYNLWLHIERLKKNNIPGAFAELGVHKGETAKAIHHMDPKRPFYLFDTFEGFSQIDLQHELQKDDRFTTKMFADTSMESAKEHIQGNTNLIFMPGFFPSTTKGLENEKFAFVHLDADLYAPTLQALKFFYPRLSPGGLILIHDYNHNWEGVSKAVDEFLLTIPESLTLIPDWQGSAMILRNK